MPENDVTAARNDIVVSYMHPRINSLSFVGESSQPIKRLSSSKHSVSTVYNIETIQSILAGLPPSIVMEIATRSA